MGKAILTFTQKQILSFLVKDKQFLNNFYLTGGTALAAYYLGHRLSEDLDFFSEKEVDKLWLTTLAKKLKTYLRANKMDIQESFNRNLVYFTTNKETVKSEFTYFPFSQIEKPKIINGFPVDSFLDIAVNKFFAIYQKPVSRHFIDLYLILKSGKISWKDLPRLARIKFDTTIDPLQLGAQLMTAGTDIELPKMLVRLKPSQWQNYFYNRAKELKTELEK